MESSMVNLIERGDKVMTLVNGRWGDVASDIAGRCGADVIRIDNGPGVPFTLTDIEQALKKHRPAILFITQGESSTGLLQPVEGIGPLCHQYDCLLVVDTVASLGAAPFFMDRWEVDVAYSASQKGISCPPGLAPISFSSRARAKISQRKTKPQSFIFDVNLEASYWGIDGAKRVYHHTPSNSLLCSLREGLSMIAQEGLENMWKRHRANKEKLWAAIEDMGLELFIQNPVYRLPTITPIKVPPGIDNPGRLNSYCMEKFDLEIAGGLPPLAGKVWRIGLMGYNSNEWILKKALDVFKEGLQHVGYVPKIKSDL
jgi:alanine-glyoxylate transaminase/serine-glyoxylate transaminase/serine-pyruvate transaminase